MARSTFREKAIQPTGEMLAGTLGGAKEIWDAFARHMETTYPGVTAEWKFYGVAWGWCLVYVHKKKKLVFLTPVEEGCIASFIFNGKARDLAGGAGFSGDILAAIASGVTNTAGHAFDIPLHTPDDIITAQKLTQIKSAS